MRKIAVALVLLFASALSVQAQPRPATTPAAPPPAAATPAYHIAVLQGLDKTTARISTLDAPIDQPVKFGNLTIIARTCSKAPPEDPPETAAFLQIDQAPPPGVEAPQQRVFSGWMIAETPSLSGLENPVYDVTLLDCKTDSGSTASAGSK
jgi:hypothetical protein